MGKTLLKRKPRSSGSSSTGSDARGRARTPPLNGRHTRAGTPGSGSRTGIQLLRISNSQLTKTSKHVQLITQ